MNQTNEQDIRVTMLNSFLSCPHRDLDKLKNTHTELQKADPLFYAHLAAWYFKKGDIRDHKEVFVGALVCDEYTDNREVGLALFREIPVYLKRRIVGFVKGKKIKIRNKTGKKIKRNKKMIDEVTIEEKNVGLYKNIPTSFKKDIEKFLHYIETNNDLFDAIALKSANDLKGLYATLRIAPSNRAQGILFDKVRPENSKLSVFEEIAKAENSTEIAKLIIKNKVPYTVAVGLVPQITPVILVALINSMSPQEVINNYASLEERGAMDNDDTKTLIIAKLEKAKTAKNVSALKSKQAQKGGRVKNEESKKILNEIADTQIKKKGVIKISTAVFVDKSGSMQGAIEVGKNVSALIAGATEAPLYVIAFDNMAKEIKAQGTGMTAWEKAFKPIRSDGGTSMGVALDFLIRKNYSVEQILVITDEGEGHTPKFVNVLPKYVKKFKTTPNITIIYIPSSWGGVSKEFSRSLKQANIPFDYYAPEGNDYYGLPGLIPLLAQTSKLDLLYEIMDTPLPVRKPFDRKKKK